MNTKSENNHESLEREVIEDAWIIEAERRDGEMDSEEVVGIPGEEVFGRIRERFGS